MPTNSIVAMMEVSWGGKLNMATIFHVAFKSNPPPYMTMPLTRKQTKFRGKSSSISFTIGKFVVFVLPSFAVNLKQFSYLCDILWQVCLRCREDICDLWGLNSHWTLIDSNSILWKLAGELCCHRPWSTPKRRRRRKSRKTLSSSPGRLNNSMRLPNKKIKWIAVYVERFLESQSECSWRLIVVLSRVNPLCRCWSAWIIDFVCNLISRRGGLQLPSFRHRGLFVLLNICAPFKSALLLSKAFESRLRIS